MMPPGERLERFVLLGGVILLTFATWYGVLAGSFQYDDFPNVILDPATFDPAQLWDRAATGFRPLLRATYFMDYELWGMYAPGFLATNLMLHLTAVLTVFALARRRLGSEFPAAIAALFFAAQPAHAAVVAYVSGRSAGLSATLLLLALLLYDRSSGWRIGALTLWVAAILTKETALVFPALLMLWEWTRPAPLAGARKRLLPFLVAAPGLALAVLMVPRMQELLAFSQSLRSPLQNLAWNAVALPEALSLWVRPWALSVEHAPFTSSVLRAVAGGAALLSLITVAVIFRRRAPYLAFAILFPIVALLPTYSIIARLDPVAENPLYLAWFGIALLAGAAAASFARSPAVLGTLAAALFAGAIWSAKRVEVWQNPVTLWTEAVAGSPASARAWNNLGMARFNAGDRDGADAAFTRALELDPHHFQAWDARLMIRLLKETGSVSRGVEPQ
jgi:hypothetical protein